MSVDRVATANQSQYMLSQIMRTNAAVANSQQQVASGKVSPDYAGIGSKTAALEAARSSAARATAYQSATTQASDQVDLQDTLLTQMSGLADQLKTAMSSALANNDATGFSSTVQSIFDQASQILNSKDANGNYLFGGDKDDTPPFTATSLSDLAAAPSVASTLVNGSQKKTVMVGDGQPVQIGVLASDIGSNLMQTLKDIATFNAGPTGNFNATLTTEQSDFLTSEMPTANTASQALNASTAANGNIYKQLTDASDQQGATATLYSGFVSDIENVDMPTAITQLNLNQTALQAALQVTSQLNQVSLLNYLK